MGQLASLTRGEPNIIHFHGYPAPAWLEQGFALGGADNIAVSCGTPQAALLNLEQSFALLRRPQTAVAALIEPGHGTNIVAGEQHLDRVLDALRRSRQKRPLVELGPRHFEALEAICRRRP